MSLRSEPGHAKAGYPRLSPDERRQFEHEHAAAYDAAEKAAQRLELCGPGHVCEVGLLRSIRRRLSQHLLEGTCDAD